MIADNILDFVSTVILLFNPLPAPDIVALEEVSNLVFLIACIVVGVIATTFLSRFVGHRSATITTTLFILIILGTFGMAAKNSYAGLGSVIASLVLIIRMFEVAGLFLNEEIEEEESYIFSTVTTILLVLLIFIMYDFDKLTSLSLLHYIFLIIYLLAFWYWSLYIYDLLIKIGFPYIFIFITFSFILISQFVPYEEIFPSEEINTLPNILFIYGLPFALSIRILGNITSSLDTVLKIK